MSENNIDNKNILSIKYLATVFEINYQEIGKVLGKTKHVIANKQARKVFLTLEEGFKLYKYLHEKYSNTNKALNELKEYLSSIVHHHIDED